MEIFRGEAFELAIEITDANNTKLGTSELEDVEISVGEKITRLYSKGEVTYDSTNHLWKCPLSQADTYSLEKSAYSIQVKGKLTGASGFVRIVQPEKAVMRESNNNTVI